jgi:hypothetical protein
MTEVAVSYVYSEFRAAIPYERSSPWELPTLYQGPGT